MLRVRSLRSPPLSSNGRFRDRHAPRRLRMRLLRRVDAMIDHTPIEGEFLRLKLIDDVEFQSARARHLARRPMPKRADNAGVFFVVGLLGFPVQLISGLIKDDSVLMASAIFWLIVGLVSFSYLAVAAKFWREHHAIRSEELRRYGHTTFG